MSKLTLLLMLITGSVIAQQKKFDFVATTSANDTVYISTAVKALSLEWKDGRVDLYAYTNGVYSVGDADIICFDDFTVARYMIVYYTSDKRDKIKYAILQYNNGSGIELNAVKPQSHGK